MDRGGVALGTAAKARDGTARGSNIITQTKLRLKRTKQNINKLEYCKCSRRRMAACLVVADVGVALDAGGAVYHDLQSRELSGKAGCGGGVNGRKRRT